MLVRFLKKSYLTTEKKRRRSRRRVACLGTLYTLETYNWERTKEQSNKTAFLR